MQAKMPAEKSPALSRPGQGVQATGNMARTSRIRWNVSPARPRLSTRS